MYPRKGMKFEEEFVKLKKEEIDFDHYGTNLKGWWRDTEQTVKKLPKGAKRYWIDPISIIVGMRVFRERKRGWKKGKYAYLKVDDYWSLL